MIVIVGEFIIQLLTLAMVIKFEYGKQSKKKLKRKEMRKEKQKEKQNKNKNTSGSYYIHGGIGKYLIKRAAMLMLPSVSQPSFPTSHLLPYNSLSTCLRRPQTTQPSRGSSTTLLATQQSAIKVGPP